MPPPANAQAPEVEKKWQIQTTDLLAGGDNDKFEQETFSSQRLRWSWTPLLHFFRSSHLHGIGTPNKEPIQQQLYVELKFLK